MALLLPAQCWAAGLQATPNLDKTETVQGTLHQRTAVALKACMLSTMLLSASLLHNSIISKSSCWCCRGLKILCTRILASGLLIGIACGVTFFAAENNIISLFTTDPETINLLKHYLWLVICVAQPLNSLVFIYDGLLYASQSFAFTRNVMLLGFSVVFVPLIIAVQWQVKALWGVWVAKAALNACRLLGGAYRIHFWWLQSLINE